MACNRLAKRTSWEARSRPDPKESYAPIFYKIRIDQITGHEATKEVLRDTKLCTEKAFVIFVQIFVSFVLKLSVVPAPSRITHDRAHALRKSLGQPRRRA